MYASNIVSDAAVFAPRPSRGGYGLQPSDQTPAEARKQGLIATLRGFLAAHAPGQHSPSRSR